MVYRGSLSSLEALAGASATPKSEGKTEGITARRRLVTLDEDRQFSDCADRYFALLKPLDWPVDRLEQKEGETAIEEL